MRARRAGVVEAGRFEIVDVDLAPGPAEVLIEVAACGICSSEIPQFQGRRRRGPPEFMGHEASGTIVEIGRDVTGFAPGDRVTGGFGPGFGTHVVTETSLLFPVPPEVPLDQALGEPLMCVTNVARAANPAFGDHVAVVGCGAMGLLTIAALRWPGLASLVAVDPIAARRAVAHEFGATHVIDPDVDDAVAFVHDLTGGGADVVVEFSGVPAGLVLAAGLLRPGQATLVMAGYHHTPATYDLSAFARKGLIAHSAHPHYSPDQAADYRRALAALARGVFPMDRILTHRYALDEIGAGFEALIGHDETYLKGVVIPVP